MKTVWLALRKWDKKLVTAAIENGIDAILTAEKNIGAIKELGLIATASEGTISDFQKNRDFVEVTIKSKKDEEYIASLSKEIAIVRSEDWTIIPLENLIAQDKKILFPVKTLEEAKVALTVLEKGVWGVLIESEEIETILEITRFAKNIQPFFPLEKLIIKEIKKISMGDRVCIDTITDMNMGEGMLVGNYSNGYFLVHAETVENPYVAPRPFRVNAGAVHAYIQLPNGKTKYLDELKTGDDVLIVNYKGESMVSSIGRMKVEKRPMLNIVALSKEGKEVSIVLQNAETIRLTLPDGKPISVVQLKPGDAVLGYLEEGGRHFGYKIKETIKEK